MKKEKKTTLIVTDEQESDESDKESSTNEDNHLYELIRGVPTVVIKCQETIDEYIPINYGGKSNVVVKVKKGLQTNKDSDQVIRRPGMIDFIP